ncbi:DUF4190 domain-containing protein [Streptomyces sp. NPDC096323]|uniref:DUF4190 domain-containing protein n=1 Tax=Streptomyces sp. NPDC096323 TaxID=3155822 RepID=UPI00332AAA55
MSDNTERPADGGSAPRDPWAPPETRVPLDKNPADARVPLDKNPADARPQTDADAGHAGPPPVHDQQTVTSMPNAGTGPIPTAGFGPPGQGQPAGPWQDPGAVPPPPVGPNGPGQPVPPPMGQYGYPGAQQSQYGYPVAPGPQYGGYPGYGGQPAWGVGPSNGMGTAAMVMGILAVCLFCVYGIPSIILGTLALIFGIIGRKRAARGEADNAGQALAGVILGSIGIAIGVVIIGGIIWLATHADEFDDDTYDGDTYGTSLVIEDAR